MTRNVLFLALCGLAAAACGGSTNGSGNTGLNDAGTGGATGSGGAGAGGATASGGMIGSGGGVNCANVGCAMPPMCETGCTEVCGCCPCAEGEVMGNRVCHGGCYQLPADAGGPSCDYNGRTLSIGDSVYSSDGCNTCSCTASGMACTAMACVCDPIAEQHERNYVATSPQQCAVIDYVCPANTTYFSNSCGCGCQQDPSCPEWFDCMPGPGVPACNTTQIQADCPYSGIAF